MLIGFRSLKVVRGVARVPKQPGISLGGGTATSSRLCHDWIRGRSLGMSSRGTMLGSNMMVGLILVAGCKNLSLSAIYFYFQPEAYQKYHFLAFELW